MKSAGLLVGLAVLLLALPPSSTEGRQLEPDAIMLFQKALAISDIEANFAPAFQLHAQFRTQDAQDLNEEVGELLLIWTPIGLRHMEVVSPDYQIVEVANGKQQWTSSNLDYIPYPIFQIQQILSIGDWLRLGLKMDLHKPTSAAGSDEECVNATATKEETPYEFCFDRVNGYLVREVNGLWNETYEYSDYQAWGERSFPRTLRIVRSDGRIFVEIEIDKIAPEEKPQLSLFLPGKGAQEQPVESTCGSINNVKLLKMITPKYPQAAMAQGISGTVRLYTDIGLDGVPRGLWPLNSPAPMLVDAAIEAVKQWRYQPATCNSNGAPVDVRTAVSFSFASR